MDSYSKYWVASAIRGLFAIATGTLILIVSDLVKTIVLLPIAVVMSSLCLAAYGVIDSAMVAASSFVMPRHSRGKIASRLQGVCGIVLGILLFLVASEKLKLSWFVYLAAAQATCTAIAEFVVAAETAKHHSSRWCYVSAMIALFSAVVLLLCGNLPPRELAWVIYGYLGFFGLNMLMLSARMLFEETHPGLRRS